MSRAAKPYTPQPGTIPAKVCAFLEGQRFLGRKWVPLAEIEDAVDQSGLSPFLVAPLRHGVLVRRHKPENLRLSEYALGDGTPLPLAADHDEDDDRDPPPAAPTTAPKPPAWPPTASTNMKQSRAKNPAQADKSSFVDINGMSITDDPLAPRVLAGSDKYGALFRAMRLGQSIKCTPADVPRVANAMRKWLSTNKPGVAVVRSVKRYPGDNQGRVWMIAERAAPAHSRAGARKAR